MKKLLVVLIVGLMNVSTMNVAQAEEFALDTEGTHVFIQFKVKHLGYSWLYGRFNKFTGNFSYDETNPTAAKVSIEIDTNSVDSNHVKRDKHIRDDDFLNVKEFPKATFVSTSFEEVGEGKAILKGDFTLHGITKNIMIDVEHVGHGRDPWGGYRRGLYGTTSIKPAEYGVKGMEKLGPHSAELFLEFSLEGIRQGGPQKI